MPSQATPKPPKRLLIRLSSLGDVILATSALEVDGAGLVDWVVSCEYSALLQGHPKVRKVWAFDRKSGFRGWVRLGRLLWEEGFDEVDDLHRTVRSRLLKVLFFYWSLTAARKMPRWKVISKQRFRLYAYFVFKSLWPKSLRPTPITNRSALLAGGSGLEHPNLHHLLSTPGSRPEVQALLRQLEGQNYVCVMPGSKWDGKKWPVESYVALLSRLDALVVVLGSDQDAESKSLVQALERSGKPVLSAVGAWSLPEVARILSSASRYLGNDTGLAHLAEAVGVPASVIFGPTREDMGFGPWRPESQALGVDLLCRPCGKDGRFCYRFGARYACMKNFSPEKAHSMLAGELSNPGHEGRKESHVRT